MATATPNIFFEAGHQGDRLWWWRNPGGHYEPDVSWERHTIKGGGVRRLQWHRQNPSPG